jgi:MoaA/NifB/PqqE/SkfB family radical SAM enzyme
MYKFKKIKTIQLEITTLCNAACPQCPRNHYGGKAISNLPIITWDLEKFNFVIEQCLNIDNLEVIYFCGTYGDPMLNPNIEAMCESIRKNLTGVKIVIHTNGGIGKKSTFKNLASKNLVDSIAFGIDGLENTNHLYRRNVKWDRLIDNVTEFIENGGNAIWDFIVFRHNEHQVKEAENISKDFGFTEFNIKTTSRFIGKNHKFVNEVDVQNTKGVFEYKLEIPLKEEYINKSYIDFKEIELETYMKKTEINCYALSVNEIYIGADGFVFPCGWLHDRLYGFEAEQTKDHQEIFNMMDESGGKESANIFSTQLQKIVDGSWFNIIQENWKTNRLERCALICGNKINSIGNQSTISYK